MPEVKLEAGSPIKQFIEKTREQTIAGLADWELKAPIELELSTVVKGEVGGGLSIHVVNLGSKVQSENIQKIKLSIGPVDKTVETEKKARIAKAKQLERYASTLPPHEYIK